MMVDLFIPTHVGCPTCNKEKKSHSGTGFRYHTPLGNDDYKAFGCNHTFNLYEALKYDSTGFFGIIGIFSQQSWHGEIEVEVGKLCSLPVEIAEELSAFAVFLTPYTPVDGPQIHYIAKPFNMTGKEITISTVGMSNVPPEALGTKMKLMYMVQTYYSKDAEDWKKILYESLSDFSEQKMDRAIFKLSQSLEMYCDRIIHRYLSKKEIPQKLIDHIFKTGKNWDARKDRILPIVQESVEQNIYEDFKSSMSNFYETIRPLRNSYSHDNSVFSHKNAVTAYEISFPIYWALEKTRNSLT